MRFLWVLDRVVFQLAGAGTFVLLGYLSGDDAKETLGQLVYRFRFIAVKCRIHFTPNQR